jgi:putative transposase
MTQEEKQKKLRLYDLSLCDEDIASAIDNESVRHHNEYVGRRIKRGLFKSKAGILINSDVNGAINIARKSKVTAIQFNTVEQIMGVVAYPKRIRVANV